MKRSEVNKALRELEAMCEKYHCYLLRYVTLLEERVVAPQRLFCLSLLPEYKYFTHSKNGE